MILFNSAPADGGDNTPAPEPTPAATPPPAALAVSQSDVKESDAAELVELRRKLQETEAAKKAREVRVAELEDENHRLKAPAPVARKAKSAPLTVWDSYAEGAD